MNINLKEAADLVGGKIIGDAETEISNIAKIEEAQKGDLTFLHHPAYEKYLATTNASVILVKPEIPKDRDDLVYIEVNDPHAALQKLIIKFANPEIHFKDEVFNLKGQKAKAMWHMLCESGKDLEISFRDIKVRENSGFAIWEADYTFSRSNRKVHNKIKSYFEFKDGKIINQIDSFNFREWSNQALGTVGLLFGWTSFLRKKVSTSANIALNRFIEKHPEYK